MFVIAGLGNPGKKYENTRHNMGFLVVDRIAEKCGISVNRMKHRALVGEGRISGRKALLVKPQTYMNLSGESVREVVDYYDVDLEDVIVIYDDFDLETGSIRVRKKGSAGSHNGMKSVISHLGSGDFPRVRIGIGKSGGSAMEAIARQPEASNDIRTNMIIIAALVEGVALFAVVVCFLAL